MEANSVLVEVRQVIQASAENVFDAWLDPRLIGEWMFGPRLREEEVLHIHVDPQVGGKFSFLVRRDNKELDHVGTYLEIDRPYRLSFTWGIAGESDSDESVVKVEIHPQGLQSEIFLTHSMDFKWADHADRIRESWIKITSTLNHVLLANAMGTWLEVK